MKQKIFFIFIISAVMVINFVYFNNKTEKVLLSGKVFGFDIENTNYNSISDKNSYVPTSLKKIGTITFIKKEDRSFVSLGHPVAEIKNQEEVVGKCYDIDLSNIVKGNDRNLGKIVAGLNQISKIGKISYINNHGLYGIIDETSDLKEIETASRFSIKKDKAEIMINIDGKGLKKYEIKIIDIDYFDINQNIKFIITSQELINLSGGIVQGMSGTPIVQNGKLIGAVNFVDIKNPLEAYGIFVDKLL